MRKYSLYRARKTNALDPENYTCKIEGALERIPWYIVQGALTYSELERCDLVYYGQNKTYERCVAEIGRLGK